MRWRLKGNVPLDVFSYYEAIRGTKANSFPWKSFGALRCQEDSCSSFGR